MTQTRPSTARVQATSARRAAPPPARKPAASTRPKALSTSAERAKVLDTRPDLSAALRAEFDKPELSAKRIAAALKHIPCKGVSFGGRVMAPNAELDRAMGIATPKGSPIKRGVAHTEFGTLTREQADAILSKRGGGK